MGLFYLLGFETSEKELHTRLGELMRPSNTEPMRTARKITDRLLSEAMPTLKDEGRKILKTIIDFYAASHEMASRTDTLSLRWEKRDDVEAYAVCVRQMNQSLVEDLKPLAVVVPDTSGIKAFYVFGLQAVARDVCQGKTPHRQFLFETRQNLLPLLKHDVA